jgi:putative flippase GtrA
LFAVIFQKIKKCFLITDVIVALQVIVECQLLRILYSDDVFAAVEFIPIFVGFLIQGCLKLTIFRHVFDPSG